jgi:peptidoglycan/LPS O-acetylase OafA/YrhL
MVIRDAALLSNVRRALPAIACVAVCGMLVIFFVAHELSARGYYTHSIGFTLLAWGYASLVMWSYLLSGSGAWLDRFLRTRPLMSLGKYSYGLYVYHAPFFFVGKYLFQSTPWFGRDIVRGWIFCAFVVAGSIVTAIVSYEVFEKRLLRLKRYYEPRYLLPSLHQNRVDRGFVFSENQSAPDPPSLRSRTHAQEP